MNAAKALVWVMSGLLLALLAILVVGLSLGWHLDEPGTGPAGGDGQGGQGGFDLVSLEQPPGTTVTGLAELDGKIAVSLSGGGRAPRIVLIDSATGETVGEIVISRAED